jgi:aryl-alcohol dehydrogenase-like predicted oxidoreductase
VLAHPAVSAAIIGASRPDQLDETLAGVHTVLSPDLKAELDRITMAHRGGPAI